MTEEFIGYKWEPQEFNVLSYVGDTLSFPIRLREKEAPQDYVDFDAFPCTFLAQVRSAQDRDSNLLKTLTVERTALHNACPYTEQWRHFRALIDGLEPPVCSALDGLRTLEATLAVHAAAESERSVRLSN